MNLAQLQSSRSEAIGIILCTYISYTTFAKLAEGEWQLMRHNVYYNYI